MLILCKTFNMAYYKYGAFLSQNNDSQFDQAFHPSTLTPLSGIYRCTVCNHEITSVAGHHLPPQNHHQHNPAQGAILWRLIIAATHAQWLLYLYCTKTKGVYNFRCNRLTWSGVGWYRTHTAIFSVLQWTAAGVFSVKVREAGALILTPFELKCL